MITPRNSIKIPGPRMEGTNFFSSPGSGSSKCGKMNSLILSACKDNLQKDLLESCKAGDLKAQLQIYNKLYKVLFNISLNIVEDTAIAENIMQETFWIAFERIHAFSGRASFVNWIINMVQDSSIECWRKKNVPVPGARMDS